MIITIDGPTASGKSTLGRLLAEELSFYYLNSGALFRAVAYLLLEKSNYTLDDMHNPKPEDIDLYLDLSRLVYKYDAKNNEQVIFDSVDIWPLLKSSLLDQAASILSTNVYLREALLKAQRIIAEKHDVVVDGRDSGSVVFPHAQVKFFLTASLEERAKRWRHLQAERGNDFTLEEAIVKVSERDKRDKERKFSPLIVPENAVNIDSSHMSINQVLDKMLEIVEQQK